MFNQIIRLETGFSSPAGTVTRPRGTRHALRIAALGLMIAGAAAAADGPGRSASPQGDALTTVVRYGDLDLSRDEGARALYARLRAAASRVCEPLDSRDLRFQQLQAECYQKALSDAVRQSGSERLAVLHSGRNERTIPLAEQTTKSR